MMFVTRSPWPLIVFLNVFSTRTYIWTLDGRLEARSALATSEVAVRDAVSGWMCAAALGASDSQGIVPNDV